MVYEIVKFYFFFVMTVKDGRKVHFPSTFHLSSIGARLPRYNNRLHEHSVCLIHQNFLSQTHRVKYAREEDELMDQQ